MVRLRDDERRSRAEELLALAEDDLEAAWVLVAGELARPRGGLDGREVDDAALDLGDGLLRDDEHVAGLEAAGARGRLGEERGEVVVLVELGDPAERDDANLVRHGRPVTRMPACPR